MPVSLLYVEPVFPIRDDNPQILRQLVQGATDRFSSTYRRLTEEYYRRLAEDPDE